MKNPKLIIVMTSILVACFIPKTGHSQTSSQRFDKFECAKPVPEKSRLNSLNFDYVIFEEYIVRRNGNHIDYLDQKLNLIDHFTLPEKADIKKADFYSYQVVMNKSYIFVCQSIKTFGNNNVVKLIETKLYQIERDNFKNLKSINIPHTKNENELTIFAKADKVFIATLSARIIQEFYTVDNENFDLSSNAYNNFLTKLPHPMDFKGVYQSNDSIYFISSKTEKSEITTINIAAGDELEILFYRKTVNNYNKSKHSVYDLQNTPIFQGNTESYHTIYLSSPKGILEFKMDSTIFYFRNLTSDKRKIDSWISTNLGDKKINTEIQFKDLIEDLNLYGWNFYIPLPDPSNESITIKMTYPIVETVVNPYGTDHGVQRKEVCVYLNLTKDLELRSIYSSVVYFDPKSMSFDDKGQIGYNKSSLITESLRILNYKSNSKINQIGNKNAYDVLNDLKTDRTIFSTIIHSLDKQYLFIEMEDGTSYGYTFIKN